MDTLLCSPNAPPRSRAMQRRKSDTGWLLQRPHRCLYTLFVAFLATTFLSDSAAAGVINCLDPPKNPVFNKEDAQTAWYGFDISGTKSVAVGSYEPTAATAVPLIQFWTNTFGTVEYMKRLTANSGNFAFSKGMYAKYNQDATKAAVIYQYRTSTAFVDTFGFSVFNTVVGAHTVQEHRQVNTPDTTSDYNNPYSVTASSVLQIRSAVWDGDNQLIFSARIRDEPALMNYGWLIIGYDCSAAGGASKSPLWYYSTRKERTGGQNVYYVKSGVMMAIGTGWTTNNGGKYMNYFATFYKNGVGDYIENPTLHPLCAVQSQANSAVIIATQYFDVCNSFYTAGSLTTLDESVVIGMADLGMSYYFSRVTCGANTDCDCGSLTQSVWTVTLSARAQDCLDIKSTMKTATQMSTWMMWQMFNQVTNGIRLCEVLSQGVIATAGQCKNVMLANPVPGTNPTVVYAGKLYDPYLNYFDLLGKARYYTYDQPPLYYDTTASSAFWTNWKYTTCFNEAAALYTDTPTIVSLSGQNYGYNVGDFDPFFRNAPIKFIGTSFTFTETTPTYEDQKILCSSTPYDVMTGGSLAAQCYAVGAAAKTIDPLWSNLCNEAINTAVEISESPNNNVVTPSSSNFVVSTSTASNCGGYTYSYKGTSSVIAPSLVNYGSQTATLSFPLTIYNAVAATVPTSTLTNHQPGNISNPQVVQTSTYFNADCTGVTNTYSLASADTPVKDISWITFNTATGQFSLSETDATHVGTWQVSVIKTNACGSSATMTVTFTILPPCTVMALTTQATVTYVTKVPTGAVSKTNLESLFGAQTCPVVYSYELTKPSWLTETTNQANMQLAWNEATFTNVGVYTINLVMTRNDGSVITQPIVIDISYGCLTVSLATAGTTTLGPFAVTGNANKVLSGLQNYFTPQPVGCYPTYELFLEGAAWPSPQTWLVNTIVTTDPYNPTVALSFTENFVYTHIGSHNIALKITLQDGTTVTKNLILTLTYGCTATIGLDSTTTESFGTYYIETAATAVMTQTGLQTRFNPDDPLCIPTYTWTYNNGSPLPSWLVPTITGTGNTQVVGIGFDATLNMTNIGTHQIELKTTLQDVTLTATKKFNFVISYGCTPLWSKTVAAVANPKDLGTFKVKTQGNEVFADMELDLMDPGCVATYVWSYYPQGGTSTTVPSWITTTTGGTAYDRTLDASISEMGLFTHIGTHYIVVTGTLQDGQTYTRTWKFTLSYGCDTIALSATGTLDLGTFAVTGTANQAFSNLQNYFTPQPIGCQPVYSLFLEGVAWPSPQTWLVNTIVTTDLYNPTVAVAFNENQVYTHIGVHNFALKVTLPDGQTLTKNFLFTLTFGCTATIGLDSTTTESFGTYQIETAATAIMTQTGLQTRFNPDDPLCIPTYTWTYNNGSPLPSWLVPTITGTGNTQVVGIGFDATLNMTNIGTHQIELKTTLQDVTKTATKKFTFVISYGCTPLWSKTVAAVANPKDLGTFKVKTQGNEVFADMELDLMDPGCVATYVWSYYPQGGTSTTVPSWITTTTGGTAYDRTLDASISEMGLFTHIGTHNIVVTGTLQDGQTYTRTWTFTLSYGCDTIALNPAGVANLGTFAVTGNANQVFSNLQNYFTPNPTGCIPTITLLLNGTALPSWVTQTQVLTDPYNPTVSVAFNENEIYTHIATHTLSVIMTTQDGQSKTQTLTFTLSYGCLPTAALDPTKTDLIGDVVWVINTNDAAVLTDFDTYFTDPGCVPTYNMYYGATGTTALPSWLTFTSTYDATVPGAQYDPNLRFNFTETNTFTHVGTHNLQLKLTLQNGTTIIKPLRLILSYGCDSPWALADSSNHTYGEFTVGLGAAMVDLNLAKYFSPELSGCITTCTYKNADSSTLYTWMNFTYDTTDPYQPYMTFFWDEDDNYIRVGVWNTRLDCVNQDGLTLTKFFDFTILDGCSPTLETVNDDVVHLGNYTLPTGEISFLNWDAYFVQPFGCPVTYTLTGSPSVNSFSDFDDIAVSWTFESKTNNQAGWYNLTLRVKDVRNRIVRKYLTIYIKPECKFTVPFAIANSAMENWVYQPDKFVSSGLFTTNNIDCGTIIYTPYSVVGGVNVPIMDDPTFTNYVEGTNSLSWNFGSNDPVYVGTHLAIINVTLSNSLVYYQMNLTHELYRCVTLFIAANVLQNQEYIVTGDEIDVNIGDLYKSGDDCQKEVTYEVKWLDNGTLKNLPSQFDFATNSKTFKIFTDDATTAGVYTIVCVLIGVVDDDPLPTGTTRDYPTDVKFTVTITALPPADDNTAPYFKPVLSTVIVGYGSTYVYSLPEVVDDQGHTWEAEVTMPGDLAVFTKFDSKNMRFIINPTDISQIKTYSVTIVLKDFPSDLAMQKKGTYTLIIQVVDPAIDASALQDKGIQNIDPMFAIPYIWICEMNQNGLVKVCFSSKFEKIDMQTLLYKEMIRQQVSEEDRIVPVPGSQYATAQSDGSVRTWPDRFGPKDPSAVEEKVGCDEDDLQCILQKQMDDKKAAEKAANLTSNATENTTNENRMLYFFSEQTVDYSKLGLARTIYENKTLDHMNIKNYVKMMIKRGANDSSEESLLEFDFTLVEFERNYLMFWLDFQYPRFVSRGSKPDILNMTWFDTNYLRDSLNGLYVLNHTVLEADFPIMMYDYHDIGLRSMFGGVLTALMNAFFILQIILAITVAWPFKSMWLWLSSLQLCVYLMFFNQNLPENAQKLYTYLYAMVFMHYIEPEATTMALELYMSPKEFIDPHHRPDYTGIPQLSVLKQMSIFGIGLIVIAILACLLIPMRAAVRSVMSPKKLSDFLNNGDISVSSSESEVSEDEKNRRSKKIKLTVQERRAKDQVREQRRAERHTEKRKQKLKERTKKFYAWKEETEKKMAGRGIPWQQTAFDYLWSIVYYNSVLRLGTHGFLQTAHIVTVTMTLWTTKDSRTTWLSVLAGFLFYCCWAVPISIVLMLFYWRRWLKVPWIKQRFWVFIWDLRLKSLWQVMYMPIFLLRRALVVLIAVTLFDYPGIQLQLFYMTQVFYMLYVWHFPHNLIQHNWQESFNEVCFFFLGYHIINFSATGPSDEMMLKVGESMIVITLIQVVVNILIVLYLNFVYVMFLIRSRWRKPVVVKKRLKRVATPPPPKPVSKAAIKIKTNLDVIEELEEEEPKRKDEQKRKKPKAKPKQKLSQQPQWLGQAAAPRELFYEAEPIKQSPRPQVGPMSYVEQYLKDQVNRGGHPQTTRDLHKAHNLLSNDDFNFELPTADFQTPKDSVSNNFTRLQQPTPQVSPRISDAPGSLPLTAVDRYLSKYGGSANLRPNLGAQSSYSHGLDSDDTSQFDRKTARYHGNTLSQFGDQF